SEAIDYDLEDSKMVSAFFNGIVNYERQ
ncbi:hypothetical protein LCGC14_1681570, partial [marine sediment metagenome]